MILSYFLYVLWSKLDFLIHVKGVDVEIYKSYWMWMSFIPHLPTIFLGIILFYYMKYNHFDSISLKQRKICMVLLLTFALWMIYGDLYGFTNIYYTPLYFKWALWFFLVFLSQLIYPFPLLVNPLWSYLGKNSLLIYLLHIMIFNFMEKYQILNQGIINIGIKFIVCLIVASFMACLYNGIDNIYRKTKKED